MSAVILLRHGEREDYAAREQHEGAAWIASADRPFDPHLTELGKNQAKAAGKAIKEHLERLGLAPVSQILTSPFQRCVDTSIAARDGLGASTTLPLGIEEGLAEMAGKDWYMSWALCGDKFKSDSTWGGPKKPVPCRDVSLVENGDLRPKALACKVEELHYSARELSELYGEKNIDMSYVTAFKFRGKGYSASGNALKCFP